MPSLPTAIFTQPSRAEILSTFRSLLREVNSQVSHPLCATRPVVSASSSSASPTKFTAKNGSKVWHAELVSTYKAARTISDKAIIIRRQAEANGLLSFLQASKEHRRLMNLYWPVSGMSNDEKLKRTANVVGLSLPKAVDMDGEAEAPIQGSMEEAARIVEQAMGKTATKSS
ncbi:hypothetical protein HDU67_007498 [Dinochytrium kinnereticum]|nr:hypothetical protein HDU67_007498 [Dinochytrium kinnereticum]